MKIWVKIIEKDFTIYDLKKELKLNPGVIKRHIDLLLSVGLIVQSKIDKNDVGLTLKYYRASAKTFKIHIDWP